VRFSPGWRVAEYKKYSVPELSILRVTVFVTVPLFSIVTSSTDFCSEAHGAVTIVVVVAVVILPNDEVGVAVVLVTSEELV